MFENVFRNCNNYHNADKFAALRIVLEIHHKLVQLPGLDNCSGASPNNSLHYHSSTPCCLLLKVLGKPLSDVLSERKSKSPLDRISSSQLVPGIRFQDLEQHRIVGTGQFGLVRVVRHTVSGKVYALKVMHKAPITESKQVEHVVNERDILEEANHPFCVGLVSAYQDQSALYLLQVRIQNCLPCLLVCCRINP